MKQQRIVAASLLVAFFTRSCADTLPYWHHHVTLNKVVLDEALPSGPLIDGVLYDLYRCLRQKLRMDSRHGIHKLSQLKSLFNVTAENPEQALHDSEKFTKLSMQQVDQAAVNFVHFDFLTMMHVYLSAIGGVGSTIVLLRLEQAAHNFEGEAMVNDVIQKALIADAMLSFEHAAYKNDFLLHDTILRDYLLLEALAQLLHEREQEKKFVQLVEA